MKHESKRKQRRRWAKKERPWYELLKKRKIPKTEWNRKDVEESRRQKRSEKQNAAKEIDEALLDEKQKSGAGQRFDQEA